MRELDDFDRDWDEKIRAQRLAEEAEWESKWKRLSEDQDDLVLFTFIFSKLSGFFLHINIRKRKNK